MTKSINNPSQSETLAEDDQQFVVRANYEIFVFILSAIQIFNSFLTLIIRNGEVERIPIFVSIGIAVFLMGDAFYRLYKAYNRRRFFFTFYGYLLFIGSLPIPFFAIARLVWYWLLTRKLRRSDYIDMESVIVQKRAQSAMLGVILAAIVVLQTSSLLILEAESAAEQANIHTAADAIWWAFVTMATVGYGDRYPVTMAGRTVALFAMVVGVGLFTVMTSYFAQSFMRSGRVTSQGRRLKKLRRPSDAENQLSPQENMASIRELLDHQESAQQAAIDELRTRLDDLEESIKR